MSDVFLEAIAELTRQCREQAAEIAELKTAVKELRERADAHGMLLAPPHRRDAVRHYETQLSRIQEAA